MNEFAFEKMTPESWYIRGGVLCAHVLCLFFIGVSAHQYKKEIPKKLIVRTVSLRESRSFAPITVPEEAYMAALAPAEVETQIAEEKITEEVEPIAPIEPIPVEPIPEIIVAKAEEKALPQQAPKQVAQPSVTKKPVQKKAASKPKVTPKKAAVQPQKKRVPTPQKQRVQTKKPLRTPQTQQQNQQRVRQNQQLAQKEKERQQALVNDALSSLEKSAVTGNQKKLLSNGTAASSMKNANQIVALATDTCVAMSAEEESLAPRERTYYDELVSRLQLSLRLPEYGEVKIKLTISRQGKVKKVAVVTSKSKRNRDYVEKTLPRLSFPSFGNSFENEQEHIFSLHLSNELNY